MGILQADVAAALRPHYELVREIGRGFSGVVFEARDLRLDRLVAIKVLEPELARTVGAERFLREVRIAARLQHPHILPVLESGEAAGFLFCVFPLVEGTSLRDRLAREGALPVEVALRLAEEVARALEHAHAHAVVHRDIKPENILLSDGQATLCDFGIARALNDPADGGLTATGVTVGTPRYMSPEQAAGTSAPDPRSDLYSLGCVLYEMLAGEPPFSGSSAGSVVRQHLSAAVPSLRIRRPQVPAEVEALVERCLAKMPADRPAGAGVLAESIAALRHGAARQAPPVRAGGPPMALARWPAAIARWRAAAFVLLLIVALAWIIPPLRPPTIDALAVLPLHNLTGDPGQEYFADGVTEALINDLSRISALRVISRTSVMAFKGSREPLPEIARRLGVDAVVEGSIVRSADRVRISAKLVQAVPERSLWSDSYERELSDIIRLQGEVSGSITRSIHARLTPDERTRLAAAPRRVDPRVFETCLRGQHLLRAKFDIASYRQALVEYKTATRLDPTYAPAWAGLADAYYNLSSIGLPSSEAMPRARAAASRALDLDSTRGEAYTVRGLVEAQYDLEWKKAERSLRRAVVLSPSSAQAHWALSMLLSETGRQEEGLASMRRAAQLDPLSAYFRVGLGIMLLRTGRIPQARSTLQAILLEDPQDAAALSTLSTCEEMEGRPDSAAVLAGRAEEISDIPHFGAQRGRILARAGRVAEARRILAGFERGLADDRQGPLPRAVIHHALGEKERAYELFGMALEERDENLLYALGDPAWREVWDDPRGQALKRRMGL